MEVYFIGLQKVVTILKIYVMTRACVMFKNRLKEKITLDL